MLYFLSSPLVITNVIKIARYSFAWEYFLEKKKKISKIMMCFSVSHYHQLTTSHNKYINLNKTRVELEQLPRVVIGSTPSSFDHTSCSHLFYLFFFIKYIYINVFFLRFPGFSPRPSVPIHFYLYPSTKLVHTFHK